MRSTLLMLAFVSLIPGAILAQDDVFSNKTNIALEKVIKDFPNRFHNIKGDLIVQRSETIDYKSIVQVPGSSSCVVTKVLVPNSEIYSWNCMAFESHDFNLARNKFKEIYNQIENTIIKVEGEKPFILSGQYRNPNELRKITSVVFELLPAAGEMKKVRIELNMENVNNNWKVSLHVADNELKDQTTASNP